MSPAVKQTICIIGDKKSQKVKYLFRVANNYL